MGPLETLERNSIEQRVAGLLRKAAPASGPTRLY